MIVGYDQLQQQFGGSSPAELVVRLKKSGVRYLIGKNGRPFTTEFALNSAMGLISYASNNMDIDPARIEIG
jgi:hypothetical protein